MMIKVAQIVGNSKTGGVLSCVMNYYRNIDRTKIQFDFYTYAPAPIDDEIRALGGEVYYIPSIINFPRAIPKLYQLLKGKGYDIIHSHMTSLSVFPLFAGKCAKIPVRICHAHSSTYKKEKTRIVKNFLKHFSTMFATDLMGCSFLAINWLYGKKAKKATLLPNAINLERFTFDETKRNMMREKLGLQNNFVIGHIGRFEYQKNHEFLLNVFLDVQKQIPTAKLVLCGIGSLLEQVRQQIENLNLQNNVIIFENINNVENYYDMFDLFVLPSRYEGLPLVAVEAQAMGLKCMMSDQISKETSFSQECEFLDIEDKEMWVNRIVDFAKRSTRINARDELISRKYDIKEASSILENFYIECVNKKLIK